MSAGLFDTVRRMVREELARLHTADIGVVTDQHPGGKDNYACSVQLRNTGIAIKRVPVATHRLGTVAIPAIGDLVLVQFVGGDVNAPIIIGSLYNNEDRPPENKDGQLVLRLPQGAADGDGAHIEVNTNDVPAILIRMGATTVKIQDDDPAVTIDAGGNGKFTIGSNGAIKLESSGNVELKGSGNVTIEASGKLTLKGAVVNIN